MPKEEPVGYIVDQAGLPSRFPTHEHEAVFWESLGRAVATFGFLEEVLGKAIFAFTATRRYNEAEIQQAYAQWIPKLERALSDPLGNLIDTYGRAVRDHGGATIDHLDSLLADLRKAAEVRNILCHASWRPPNPAGVSVPFFVNRQKMLIETAMDSRFIDQVQRHTTALICAVMDTVTCMGWQFPGSMGPGKKIHEE